MFRLLREKCRLARASARDAEAVLVGVQHLDKRRPLFAAFAIGLEV